MHFLSKGCWSGIECFVAHNDRTESGWQAKYFFEFGANQVAQLDKSIEQALAKHPRLRRYIVCLPINLRDQRTGKAHSQLERWQAWVKKWQANAHRKGRALAIELWDETQLLKRLTQSGPDFAGRVQYWFDHATFAPEWFRQRFEEARAGLGERYTPETNVDLPIRRSLLAFARDPAVQREIEEWFAKLEGIRYRAINEIGEVLTDAAEIALVSKLDASADKLARALSSRPLESGDTLPTDVWKKEAGNFAVAINECIEAIWNRERDTEKRAPERDDAIYSLRRLNQALDAISDALRDNRWQIVNSRRLLVYGDAGVGKSHLFGDAVAHCITHQQPAILALGSNFVDGDPWRQILDQLGLHTLDSGTFLGALDAAAQAANTRALLLIDALNERKGLDVWPARLAGFLRSIEPFPRVAIALSCRSTYLPYVVPATITEVQLPRIEHVGFAGRAGEAARIYLDRRGIVRMAAPNLVPEFENPLFLKTACDYLKKEGLSEFPRGLHGVSQIFEFYFSAVARQVESRFQLDPHPKFVARAISALANAVDTSERGYICIDAASNLLESILPSQGLLEKSLLSQLESEGMLAVEPLRLEDGSIKEYVRFTFERYSDHRIAARLFDQHLDPTQPLKAFAAGTALHAYLTKKVAYRKTGVIEAMAIQLPERTELELPDALPAGHRNNFLVRMAFCRSVLWRDQRHFRNRTVELLKEISRETGHDEVLRTFVAVATEPENQFNAVYLHRMLVAMTMPDRDQQWSTFVADEANSGDSHVQTLIEWTSRNGLSAIEDGRAELAAVALAWLFTTSHRSVRDRATKALVALLAKRLPLASRLIRQFVGVNDLYVIDRVVAAAYGAALQGLQDDKLSELAETVFECIFDVKQPVTHILIRDHARGIIELAKMRDVLPKRILIIKAKPPHNSPWPLENVSAKKIAMYVEKFPCGKYTDQIPDQIVNSCVNDGDFARYVIDYAVHHWSSLPISAAGMTQKALFEQWRKKILHEVPKSSRHLQKVINICDLLRAEDKRKRRDSEPLKGETSADAKAWKNLEAKLKNAETQLKQALEERWTEYCEYARSYIQRDIHRLQVHYSWPPPFSAGLARRWISKRAHDLGWTPERFAQFDRNVGHDRQDHRIERIGKKYQWIALHELLARVADNAAFTDHSDKLKEYTGPWQTMTRDIDPSLLAENTHGDQWRQWEPTWWMSAKASLKPISREARLIWLATDSDMMNDESLIAVTEPRTNREWLVVDEYAAWHQWSLDRGERTYERVATFEVSRLLVQAGERDKLIGALSGRIICSDHELPLLDISKDGYVGEYCWHPLYEKADGWVPPNDWNRIPVDTQPASVSYSAKRCEYDYSLAESFSFNLPGPGLAKGMSLHFSDGSSLYYADDEGQIVFFDPSIKQKGPSAALVERTTFLQFLRREKLEAIWILSRRKEVFGGKRHGGGWGGERLFCSIFWLKAGGFSRLDHVKRTEPTREQLNQYLADDEAETPSGLPPSRGSA